MLFKCRNTLEALSPTIKSIILKVTLVLILAIALGTIYLAVPHQVASVEQVSYQTFMKLYRQTYRKDQPRYRQFAFYETYDQLIFNQKQLDQHYKQAINNLTSVTLQQFQELYMIVTAIARVKGYQEIAQFEDSYHYDWQEFMPPVKDMKDYDGSHIFAATAITQFQINKKNALEQKQQGQVSDKKSWITLSEQEVIDCCANCSGQKKKHPVSVYKHIINYGISTDEDYPYTSSIFRSHPGRCKTQNKLKQFKISDWHTKSGCHQLEDRLKHGPVVVKVDARNWRGYKGGIFSECGSVRNHYALLVGKGIGYWKIRNSWGSLWGQHRHIRIKNGRTCGICGHSSYVDLK